VSGPAGAGAAPPGAGGFDSEALRRWRDDRSSGGTALARGAAALLQKALAHPPAGALAELAPVLRSLGGAHPAAGAVWRLLDRVARVHDKARKESASPECAAERMREAVERYAADLGAAETRVGEAAAALIPDGAVVATYGRSSAVEAALLEARRRGRRFRVLLSEVRPHQDGVALAAALGAAGAGCVLSADATLPMLLARARLVLVGAEAVTPRGLVLRAGSYPLLLAARELSLPVHALAPRAAFLDPPPGTLDLPLDPPEPLLADPPAGVEAINARFEECPFALVAGVLTEGGYFGATEAVAAARMGKLHPSLGTEQDRAGS